MFVPLTFIAVFASPVAGAEQPDASEEYAHDDVVAGERSPRRAFEGPLRWGGLMIPYFGSNTQDGFGLGIGGEVFVRPIDQVDGYLLKVTASFWGTIDAQYTSDFVQVHYLGKTKWLGRLGYRGWSDHVYVGLGGARAERSAQDGELGNNVFGPLGFLGLSRPLPFDEHAWIFAQTSFTAYVVEPLEGGVLATERAAGSQGATHVDVTLGLEHDTTDRWPMPTRGHRLEASVRVGASDFWDDGFAALIGGNAEVIAWHSFGRHLVVGGRFLADKTWGDRPFFTQDYLGGRWRDELGSEQAFSGYGRTRTRGDGAIAGMLEVRPFFFRTRHRVLDFEFHGSVFVEEGYLFDGANPGPPLPTVGVGLQVLFQGAVQCRPFVAWGWRSDVLDGPTKPVPQFGISFLDPL